MPILCPTDLSPASHAALVQAVRIARAAHTSVTLVHVTRKGDAADANHRLMQAIAAVDTHDVAVHPVLHEGAIIDRIAQEARDHDLMVAGTHGIKGLREALLGADMLRLVRRAAIPTFVVQEHSPLSGLERIVMPVGGHDDIQGLLDDVTFLGRLAGAEVHLLQVDRPGAEPSAELLRNKEHTLTHFAAQGIRCTPVNEPADILSPGFAGQTIRYAQRIGASCIAVMANASAEFAYIADADKERLLTNAPGIPVLCSI